MRVEMMEKRRIARFLLGAFLLGTLLSACGGEGDFAQTGSMRTPRHGHTATRLASGEILLAAGLTKTDPLADFEIYDPARGVFRPYAPSGLPKRGWHEAVLLPEGVLIAGGWTSGGEALRSAAVLLPAGGVAARTRMKYGRYDHTMTRLPNGDVLIAGGNDGKRAMRHLEVYAPDKGAFSLARRPMLIARQQHTATALGGAGVLIVGGAQGPGARYAELYLPAPGRTRLVRSLTTQRSRHTATRLADDRVLIAGGLGREGTLGSAEMFDPKTETFAPLENGLRTKRQQHTATRLADGRVVLLGGWGGEEGHTLSDAEVFDPKRRCFRRLGAEMRSPRRLHTATALGDGRVLVVGGASDQEVLASAEILEIPPAGGC